MIKLALKFRPKDLLDLFTHRPVILVQSVVPPGEFANSQLAVLHKFGAYLLRFDFDVGGVRLPDEIDRG